MGALQFRAAAARSLKMAAAGLALAACANAQPLQAAPGASAPAITAAETVRIWPHTPPNANPPRSPESQQPQDQGWRMIQVVHNVSDPTLTVFRPPPGQASGAAMIVLPGGAFAVLAYDLEGTEVAQFLAAHGVTAFVLKYRVTEPTPELQRSFAQDPRPAHLIELMTPTRANAAADGEQAVRYLRANAARFGIDPNRIGMMGFSAGAMTTMRVLHDADDGARPNLGASIYGMMLESGAPAHAPPIFLAAASDDTTLAAQGSVDIYNTWRAAGAPAELHIFETGQHGFGLGRPGTASTAWPSLFETFLRAHGFISPPAQH
ncbi:MAG: alpha/beta hydrolase [Terricaulis sp.]